jgi:1-deoxy-D-xylulose-5-phosphate reductoisomerase
MKTKIAILGSTGSIGKTLINILKNDKKNFEIVLLSSNKNIIELEKQVDLFNVKNLIITDKKSYLKIKSKKKFKKKKIHNDFSNINKIFRNKIDYVMSSISGIEGLNPTIKIIKHTKKIAIANKEAIICGWNIIQNELDKNKTKFIPVDSEHFSIHYALKKNMNHKNIENIFLTASGGPLKDLPLNKFKSIKINDALKHPNWKMGKKISIDSATMMNKVFEIIEAHKIFNVPYKKLKILIHPKSYVHAIIKFSDGMIKIIAHDTSMTIPIHNSIYYDKNKFLKTKNLNIKSLNNLELYKVNYEKFPLVKIISKLIDKNSLFETVIVAANDELVSQFLNKKIKFTDLSSKLIKFINLKEFNKYKKIKPKNIESIEKLNQYVRFKINNISI